MSALQTNYWWHGTSCRKNRSENQSSYRFHKRQAKGEHFRLTTV